MSEDADTRAFSRVRGARAAYVLLKL